MHDTDRDVDAGRGRKRHPFTVYFNTAVAILDQQYLMQTGMAMRHKLPVMEAGAEFDGFAMNNIGQFGTFTEQIEIPDIFGAASFKHVRFVQVLAETVHSLIKLIR